MLSDATEEARRQVQICNACRYCEGFCAVFPAIHRQRSFVDGEILQIANLCHNCRGCHYACQYAPPHEFDMNLPDAFATVQRETWKELAWPSGFAGLFHRSGVALSVLMAISIALLFWVSSEVGISDGSGFYMYMSHGLMVSIFTPAFLFPLLAIGISIRRYWTIIGGGRITRDTVGRTIGAIVRMDNLGGGHGEGCNFEDEDRFSNSRRWYHQATLLGFLLCFASTCSGTVLHYGFGVEAPYGLLSIPKLLGIPGGILICVGTAGLALLKLRSEPHLGSRSVWGGEMAFVLLLFAVSATGLLLYSATGSSAVEILLPVHLGFVLTFFLATPYSKMAHGFYRTAALLREHERAQPGGR